MTTNEHVTAAAENTGRVSGRVSPATARVFATNLVVQVLIVVTGGLVRLTSSGLGCPTWPDCTGSSLTPVPYQAQGWHKYVEFGNRMLTFIVVLVAIAAFVAAVRHHVDGHRRRPLVWIGAIGPIGVIAQAVLGGFTVLTHLNPVLVGAHFLLSMGLIAAAIALCQRGNDEGDDPPHYLVPKPVRWLAIGLIANALAVLTMGTIVTGSGPHSGDSTHVARYPFDVRNVAWVHADLVLLFIGLTVGMLVTLAVVNAPRSPRVRTVTLLVVTLSQGVVGYVQYFTGLPWYVVALHVLGACLVWLSALWVWFALRTRAYTPRANAIDMNALEVDALKPNEGRQRDGDEKQGQVSDGPMEQPHGLELPL
jgi:heme a synthase